MTNIDENAIECNLYPLIEAANETRAGYYVGGDSGSEVYQAQRPIKHDGVVPIWYCGRWYTSYDAYVQARKENGETNG